MSNGDEIARYSFLPWLRQGIANNIKSNPAVGKQRTSIEVSVDVETDTGLKETLTNTIQLVGPSDIIGLSTRAIVRTEPRAWSTDFEPNFLPFIEFNDEDLPWRYSPMPADTTLHRITPWLTLVVLAESEFDKGANPEGPLPFIDINADPATILPDASQLWAWAHVHVNSDLKSDSEGNPIGTVQSLDRLEQVLDTNPDAGYSRLMCSRKLEPATDYHAFLIPTFETGRLAGLGLDIPTSVDALANAWSGGQTRFPIFHTWYFRTGERGDFEYLVRLLEPRPVDERIGIRDMDVSEPGSGLSGINMGPDKPRVIGMEGALRAPQTQSTDWPKSYPEPFQTELAALINKADDYQQANPDSDPVITPPLYGRWHALRQRLDMTVDSGSDNPYDPQRKWLTELNLDPRHRAAAGLGSRVVQQHQEAYMNQAWRQIGDVLEANRRLKLAQLAEMATTSIYNKHYQNFHPHTTLSITQPLHKKVLASPETVYIKLKNSRLPQAALSPEFRRITRPRGALAKRATPELPRQVQPQLLQRINTGEVTATPAKAAPAGAATLPKASAAVAPPGLPNRIQGLLSNPLTRWLPLLIIVMALLLLLLAGMTVLSLAIVGIVTVIMAWLQRKFIPLTNQLEAAESIKEVNLTPEAVDGLPFSPDFRVTDPAEEVKFTTGHSDSVEGGRFKTALKDLHTVLADMPPAQPDEKPAALSAIHDKLIRRIDPRVTINQRVLSTLILPPLIRTRIPDRVVPVMAYPEFPQPMYKPLRDISTEFLCPNIDLVPPNTLSLLVTNQKFIESYMVGLNHEMGRELLWREYVTDQRGSYFRQFWGVNDYVNKDTTLTEAQLAEKLKDIPEIHEWLSTTALGSHNHREAGGDTQQLVLLVRGELLKRYPNTVIYAHRAAWQKNNDGSINKNVSRLLAPIETSQQQKDNEIYPLYSAQLEPDIYFLGFDLTVDEVRGQNEDDAGWFFVLKERVGEPRFGLDIDAANLGSWDDFNWPTIDGDLTDGGYIVLTDDTGKYLPAENPDDVQWHAQSNAADLAHILYQDPVLVAVHGAEMLPK